MGTKQRNHILFDEDTHTYTNIITGEVYLSSTTFVGKFHEKFDGDRIAQNLIKTIPRYQEQYAGVAVEDAIADLKAQWKRRSDIGTAIHKILENYFLGLPVFDESKGEKWNNRISVLINAYDQLKLQERNEGYEFIPEMLLYNDKFKLAGQSDIILLNPTQKTFKVLDYKTNQKGIDRKAYKDAKMFEPIAHIPDCNFYHYSLQLSLYAYFLEEESNFQCESLSLLWINTNNPSSITIEEIPVPRLYDEVHLMLAMRSSL